MSGTSIQVDLQIGPEFRDELFILPASHPACYHCYMDNNQAALPAPASPAAAPSALSPRQLAARRANAKKSTGPRTPEGKSRARLNALKHGFFARDVVNPELDGPVRAGEFNSILDALLEEFQPESARERILIDEVAASCWRIRRLLRYECRESWVDEDEYRRRAYTETPSDSIFASMGYDHHGDRLRTARKLQRSGLDALILPSDSDVDKIVRFERTVKRNLYRARDAFERMRAARNSPDSSESPADKTRRRATPVSRKKILRNEPKL